MNVAPLTPHSSLLALHDLQRIIPQIDPEQQPQLPTPPDERVRCFPASMSIADLVAIVGAMIERGVGRLPGGGDDADREDRDPLVGGAVHEIDGVGRPEEEGAIASGAAAFAELLLQLVGLHVARRR